MNSLTNEPWAILNKCKRMVDTYIADMDKHLSCCEWPDSYPEPKYHKTLLRYLLIALKTKSIAQHTYSCQIANRFHQYCKDIGIAV